MTTMGELRDFTPGQNPALPVPTAGDPQARRLSALLTHNPWFDVQDQSWVPGWNRHVGDLGKTPGWVLPITLN